MIDRSKQICAKYAEFAEEPVPFDAVLFGNRNPLVSEARRVIFYVLYFEYFGQKSQSEISELFNLKRCSVNYAVKTIRERMKYDYEFSQFIKSLNNVKN